LTNLVGRAFAATAKDYCGQLRIFPLKYSGQIFADKNSITYKYIVLFDKLILKAPDADADADESQQNASAQGCPAPLAASAYKHI
jgi:hypothetical protein